MESLLVKGLSRETWVMRDKGEENFKNNIPVPHFSFQSVGEAKFSLYHLKVLLAGPES